MSRNNSFLFLGLMLAQEGLGKLPRGERLWLGKVGWDVSWVSVKWLVLFAHSSPLSANARGAGSR